MGVDPASRRVLPITQIKRGKESKNNLVVIECGKENLLFGAR